MNEIRNTQIPGGVSAVVQRGDNPRQEVFSFAELPLIIRLGRSAIYDKLNSQSPRFDPSFPKPFKLGKRAVAFDAAEVRQWREAQKAKSRNGGKL